MSDDVSKYLAQLRKREAHLRQRIRAAEPKDLTYDKLEAAALRWAIDRLQHLEPRGS
jgi:hypothetical protein